MAENRQDAESIEIVLGTLLRWGTIISAVVIAVGGAAYLWANGGDTPHYGTFHGEPSDLKSVFAVVADAGRFDARSTIQFGMLLLIGTPIARVIGALVAFAVRRDATYVVISSLVLAALLYGLFVS